MSKIVYTVRPLKKGERYATMQEAVQKNKVGVFGLNKVDQKIIEHTKNKKLADKQQATTKKQIAERMGAAMGKVSRARRTLNDEMASEAQREQAKKDIQNYGQEYNMWLKKMKDLENGKVEKIQPVAEKAIVPSANRKAIEEKQKTALSIAEKILANKTHELTEKEYQMINQEMGQLQNMAKKKQVKKTMTKNLVSNSDLLRLYNAMDMMYIEVQRAIDYAYGDTSDLELYMEYIDDAMDEIGKFATIKRKNGKRTLINKGVDISMYNSLAKDFVEHMDGLYKIVHQIPNELVNEAKYYADKFPDLKIKSFRTYD